MWRSASTVRMSRFVLLFTGPVRSDIIKNFSRLIIMIKQQSLWFRLELGMPVRWTGRVSLAHSCVLFEVRFGLFMVWLAALSVTRGYITMLQAGRSRVRDPTR
jgi:hypothetical protein